MKFFVFVFFAILSCVAFGFHVHPVHFCRPVRFSHPVRVVNRPPKARIVPRPHHVYHHFPRPIILRNIPDGRVTFGAYYSYPLFVCHLNSFVPIVHTTSSVQPIVVQQETPVVVVTNSTEAAVEAK